MRNPLRYRDPTLLLAILDAVYSDVLADVQVVDVDPLPWTDLVDAFTSDAHDHKTVDNAIRDLVAFGALYKVGSYQRGRPDTRAVRPTNLGRAWLAGESLAIPTPPDRTTT